jgi:hypothetical protein
MKERLKKFYEEHKEAIWIGGTTSVLYLTACVFLGQDAKREINRVRAGGVITDIEPLIRADGISVILAHARDGRTYRFERNQ